MSDYIIVIFWYIIGVCVGYALGVTLKFIYVNVIVKKQLTPFQKAGYTKDTKFKVLKDIYYLKEGDIVTLSEDDGTEEPLFKTEDGWEGFMYLPNTIPSCYDEELEVYKEEN